MRRGGIVFSLLICLMVAAAAGVLVWVFALPTVLEESIREWTGVRVRIKSLVANPLSGTLEARALTVLNPPGFGVAEFLSIRELRADIRLLSLWKRPIEIDAVRIVVSRLNVEVDAMGRRNIDVLGGPSGVVEEARQRSSGSGVARVLVDGVEPLHIGRLEIKVEKAAFYGPRGVIAEKNFGFERRFERVSRLNQLMPTIADALSSLGVTEMTRDADSIGPPKAMVADPAQAKPTRDGAATDASGSSKADFWNTLRPKS